MAEILGIGLTHYPLLTAPDDRMADLLRYTLEDPDIPAEAKDLASWPEAMRREWSDDGGTAAAARHREALRKDFAHLREVVDDFAPDVIVIWGDDQYENFREDVIPPFSVLAYPDFDERPWANVPEHVSATNVWGEPRDWSLRVRGHQVAAKRLASGLLEQGIDVAYAYKPLHQDGWGHAFTNTLLFLDYDRKGFDYPCIAFHVNCYGRRVVAQKGSLSRFADAVAEDRLDPPSPSPARCMQLGATAARVMAASPWRTVLIASSSWSHAFLTDKNWRLWPDTDADRALFAALKRGDYGYWESRTLSDIEASGQQELLNWFCLLGAMRELGRTPDEAELVETHIFNSNKCFAVFRP
jgi:hypothetical protein